MDLQSPKSARTALFETAALPNRNALYQAAYGLTGSRVEAEDLVQETYLQAWKAFDCFEAGSNCRAWLFAILVNKVREYRRGWKFRHELMDDPESLERLQHAECSETADREYTTAVLRAAIRTLPQNYARPFFLFAIEGLSYREIAELTGCPIGTVMSRISRSRQRLRDGLREIKACPVPKGIASGS